MSTFFRTVAKRSVPSVLNPQLSAVTPRQAFQLHIRRASRIPIPIASSVPQFPTIETCPAATCTCRATPTGLDIDRDANLNGSIAAYAEQVLICTGRSDWASRIDEDGDAVLLRQLKNLLGRGGRYADPYHNVLLTNSSIPSATPALASTESHDSTTASASLYLVPSFRYIPSVETDSASVEALIKAFILPTKLHPAHTAVSSSTDHTSHLVRQSSLQQQGFPDAQPITETLVLICGHGARDSRCGVLGPLLEAEFSDQLVRANFLINADMPETSASGSGSRSASASTARVAQISHIGGHKYAGNVIIYVPPETILPSRSPHPLAGCGIWYGRVGPEHVQGIIEETIVGGTVIKEFFRGGIGHDGQPLRL